MWDPCDGTANDLDVDGLAISGSDLFAFELAKNGEATTASTLVTVDATTAQASIVQDTLNGRDIRGAVFNASGTLLAIDALGNALFSIDTSTGAQIGAAVALSLNAQPYNLGDAADIAFNAVGTLYLGDAFDVFTLDPSTGVLTQVFTETNAGPDGSVPAFTGLAFTDGLPADALITYDVANFDDIYRYDIDTAFARTQLLPNILDFVNAGRGDLAANVTIVPIPPVAALLTAPMLLILGRRRR